MSVVSRVRFPVWARAARVAVPATHSLRFSTAASARTALDSSKASKQQHLELLLQTGSWKSSTTTEILHELKNRRSISLTQRVIAECVDSKTLSENDFVRVLQCFGVSNDAESALNFYKSAVETRPELQSIYSLQALLAAIRPDDNLYTEALDIYHRALEDSTFFPTLRKDQHAAASALKLYAFIPSEKKLPAHLTTALALRDMLVAEGVALDVHFYGNLILVASNHSNYALAQEIYAESQATLPEPSVVLESAILKAAIKADHQPDCMAICERVASSSGLPLNDKVVLSMLHVAARAQSKELTLSIAQQWRAAGGVLTWPMCDAILTLGLDRAMLATLSTSETTSAVKSQNSTPKAPQKEGITEAASEDASVVLTPEALKAAQSIKSKFVSDWIKLLRGIVNQVRANLFEVRSRVMADVHNNIEENFSLRSDSANIAHTVPVQVMAKVAALVTEKVPNGLELMLLRLEHVQGAFPSVEAQKQAHVSVMHALARDLALLGRWRELLSLSHRLAGYRGEGDALRYTPAERAAVETCAAFALIRNKYNADRAAQQLSTRLVACLTEASAEELTGTISSVLQTLHTLGDGTMPAAELAQVLRHCVLGVDPTTAERLVTEALLSAVLPGEINRYLLALVGANAATSSEVRGFKLADHHVDIIEAVLSAEHSALQRKWVDSARELVVSLTTPLAGV